MEFSLPFQSTVARHEAFSLGFDGTLMALACVVLTIMHPGRALKAAYDNANVQGEREAKEDNGSDDGSFLGA